MSMIMSGTRTPRVLAALCGIIGTAALVAYYAAPFTFMPMPATDATAAQVAVFGAQYHNAILVDAWLQVAGSLLSVVFALALVHLAGVASRFAGRLTLFAGTVAMTLALAESTFELGAVQTGTSGNPQGALTLFELTLVFSRVFLIAPSLYLMLGAALLNTRLLPRGLAIAPLALGIAFQILGVVNLFSSAVTLVVLAILIIQEVWAVVAAIVLAVGGTSSGTRSIAQQSPVATAVR